MGDAVLPRYDPQRFSGSDARSDGRPLGARDPTLSCGRQASVLACRSLTCPRGQPVEMMAGVVTNPLSGSPLPSRVTAPLPEGLFRGSTPESVGLHLSSTKTAADVLVFPLLCTLLVRTPGYEAVGPPRPWLENGRGLPRICGCLSAVPTTSVGAFGFTA
jgi:hypothetical protein